MAQFDVFRLSDGPLVVDCQADLLSDLESRFVVPLLSPGLVEGSAGLNPRFLIRDEVMHLFPQGAATVQASELREPIGSLADDGFTILNAIEFLLTGV
jgi:toxin CcdB